MELLVLFKFAGVAWLVAVLIIAFTLLTERMVEKMKYYKAKQYIDDPKVYGGVIVEHELFTSDEMKRYNMMEYIGYFEVVDIKPKNTYFTFGARFEMEVENNDL